MAELIRDNCQTHRETKSHNPWWDRVELGLKGRVVERLDNGGSKLGIAIGRDNEEKVHETGKPDFPVMENPKYTLGI